MNIIMIKWSESKLLGKREPEIYGSETFEDFFETLKTTFPSIEFVYFQSNIEGELIDKIKKLDLTSTVSFLMLLLIHILPLGLATP